MIEGCAAPLKTAIPKGQTRVKFALVGLWNTIFGYLAFVGIDSLFVWVFSRRAAAYLAASVLANIVAIIHAYVFHKFVTFRSPARGKEILREFARFFSTYLGTMILGVLLLPVFVESLSMDPKAAAAVIIPITVVVSYVGHSRFSFKNK